ncbi:GlxA family transcriptional regulator [Paraburkholderia sp. B3]|uniref:GlxA family transcriptional regulator n=1 Tax=Paraburkholderia sp. B3 TaxID=3134791 RepID=UPI003981FEB0
MARIVAILALPGVQLLDVSGPLDVFAQANREAGRHVYDLRVVACRPGPIRSSSGVRLVADAVAGAAAAQGQAGTQAAGEGQERIDTLLVAGAPDAATAQLPARVQAWLRASAARSRRYGSVCTGAFVLAASGLLHKRRVTTHWAAAERLAQMCPGAIVEADSLYVRDGKLRTAAGVTAGLDLALSLVEEDLGREIAMRVASQLVMFFKRPGGQLQFSRGGAAQPSGRSALQEVQRWVAAHPEEPHRVPDLAARVGLSPRHFARLFQSEVGMTPAAWVETVRVNAARGLLETSGEAPKRVATRCGFANADTLRRAFIKHVGVTPAEYRRRFASHAAAGTTARQIR